MGLARLTRLRCGKQVQSQQIGSRLLERVDHPRLERRIAGASRFRLGQAQPNDSIDDLHQVEPAALGNDLRTQFVERFTNSRFEIHWKKAVHEQKAGDYPIVEETIAHRARWGFRIVEGIENPFEPFPVSLHESRQELFRSIAGERIAHVFEARQQLAQTSDDRVGGRRFPTAIRLAVGAGQIHCPFDQQSPVGV